VSDPKLLSIIKVFHTRLATIDGTGDFYSTIGASVTRGQQHYNPNDLPSCAVFLGPRSKSSKTEARSKLDTSVIIEAHIAFASGNPEDTGIEVLSDIQRAVETSDSSFGGLLVGNVTFHRDEISYPENAGNIVSVRVEYEIPHIRRYGDPVN